MQSGAETQRDGFEGYRLVRHEGAIYAVPLAFGTVDLNDPRVRSALASGESLSELRERIDNPPGAHSVEFTGWLPVFRQFGNCGAHPQFAHVQFPPPGYRFKQSTAPEEPARTAAPAAGRLPEPLNRALAYALRFARLAGFVLQAFLKVVVGLFRYGPTHTLRTAGHAFALFGRLLRNGGNLATTIHFMRTRNFDSQVLLKDDSELTFVTSVPFTYGQRPWVIEIEDSTTLFFPFFHNGTTHDKDIRGSRILPLVRTLLEHPNCRAVLTHMRSTAESLPTLFQSEIIAAKTRHVTLGVKIPQRWNRHESDPETLHLLFTNSWHQSEQGFALRGGLDVLEAFGILFEKYPHLRLTMRSRLPRLEERHAQIIERCWIRIIDRFLPSEQLEELQQDSSIYLLPAARIHIVSVLQAMSYGQAVVVSDGWGMDEYVRDGENGLIVRGRYGKSSWMDHDTGILRENYVPMRHVNPDVVEGIVAAVSRLVEDFELRRRIGRTARADVENRYNLVNWNLGLKAVFDEARGAAPIEQTSRDVPAGSRRAA